MSRFVRIPTAVMMLALISATPTTQPRVVRVAIIGGMNETGFWESIAKRFEDSTGIHVDAVATGNKDGISGVYKQGGIDLLTMHASDTIINLVADGYARDPQPWVKNDFVIVGPADDPAKTKGMTDAAAALKKIIETKSAFVIHASLGAQEVLRNILEPAGIEFDPQCTTSLIDDHQRRVLKIAAEKKAYTLIGRIPFRSGKIPNDGMVVMVEGDERLRRPFMVVVTDPRKFPDAHFAEAQRLAAFLRSPETQAFIAEFGKGKFDDRPLFFPIESLKQSTTRPTSNAILSVGGEVAHAAFIDAATFAKLPRQSVTVKDKAGKETTYEGALVREVIKSADASIFNGGHGGTDHSLCVIVTASDGYRVVFSLGELDGALRERQILLADKRDGRPLDARESPLRLIVPDETTQSRSVRKVSSISLRHVDP